MEEKDNIFLSLNPQSAFFLQLLLILEKDNLIIFSILPNSCELSIMKRKDYKIWLTGIIKQLERKLNNLSYSSIFKYEKTNKSSSQRKKNSR